MSLRRGGAMQALGVARPPRDPRPRRRRGRHLRFLWHPDVARRQTEATDENREAEVRRLAELAIEQGKEAGAVKQERENLAVLQSAETKKTETESKNGSPREISHAQDRAALEDNAAPLALGQQKDRAAREKFRAAVGPDTQTVTADWRVAQKKKAFRESVKRPGDQAAGNRRLFR